MHCQYQCIQARDRLSWSQRQLGEASETYFADSSWKRGPREDADPALAVADVLLGLLRGRPVPRSEGLGSRSRATRPRLL